MTLTALDRNSIRLMSTGTHRWKGRIAKKGNNRGLLVHVAPKLVLSSHSYLVVDVVDGSCWLAISIEHSLPTRREPIKRMLGESLRHDSGLP